MDIKEELEEIDDDLKFYDRFVKIVLKYNFSTDNSIDSFSKHLFAEKRQKVYEAYQQGKIKICQK